MALSPVICTRPVICTWFVADDTANATFFPQVNSRSDAAASQAVYWRCTAGFYASSLAVNPVARHVFFTNTRLPVIDGTDFAALFDRWGIETVTLPITYRLPRDAVSSWGNQFYIFDILDHFAAQPHDGPVIVLDSDCLWLKPVDEMAQAIDAAGALAYRLDHDEHADGSAINGLTRAQMAKFLGSVGGPARDETPYFGGEIFAARADVVTRLAERARALWPQVIAQGSNSPREEAHFLSILYALEGMDQAMANGFIRRMWTTFHHNNLQASDASLAIWHLPAEKKTGFADLFREIAARPNLHPARDGKALGLTAPNYARLMGWPRRRPIKFLRDLSLKVAEKVRA